jgi:pentapeptide repeat protein
VLSPPPAVHVTGSALTTATAVSATSLVKRLSQGEVVDLAGIIVSGELDLRSVQAVRSPFRCIGCVFTGGILARDVIFQRILDLSGSRIDGSLDGRGAVFQSGFLFRGTADSQAEFSGPANLAQATFGDGTGFDRATFAGPSDFTGARFLGESSFADALFQADAVFDDVSFAGNTLFSSPTLDETGTSESAASCPDPVVGAFLGAASFNRAAFRATADFRQRCFVGEANFQSATFGKRADFALTSFLSGASFDGASFESDGAFLASTFGTNASFLQVAASRSLVFEDAEFDGHAGFFRLAVSDTLSFQDTLFLDGVDLQRALVGNLMMDLADVAKVEGRTKGMLEVLALIEKSATGRGDLAVANDARFQLLVLQNARLGWFSRTLDWFFYRLVAGYLVRPLYPLLAFLALLGIGGLIRSALWLRSDRTGRDRAGRGKGSRPSMAQRGHARLLSTTKLASAVFERLGDTIQVAFRRKPQITLEDKDRVRSYWVAGVKWVEFIAFKVLIALFLLALASSNSTLKQLFDSVRG